MDGVCEAKYNSIFRNRHHIRSEGVCGVVGRAMWSKLKMRHQDVFLLMEKLKNILIITKKKFFEFENK